METIKTPCVTCRWFQGERLGRRHEEGTCYLPDTLIDEITGKPYVLVRSPLYARAEERKKHARLPEGSRECPSWKKKKKGWWRL